MTLEQFVNQKVAADPGFRETATAADNAQKAYHFIADTPIQELASEGATIKAAGFIDRARDAFRRAGTYRINEAEPSLDTGGFWITDGDPGIHRVGSGAGVVTLVQVTTQGEVLLFGLETSRGVEILHFGAGMGLDVRPTFVPFMVGDSVDVESIRAIVTRIRRGDDLGSWPPARPR